MRYVTGIDEQGKAFEMQAPPLTERFSIFGRKYGCSDQEFPSYATCTKFVHTLLEIAEIFGRVLSLNSVFSYNVEQAFKYLASNEARAAVEHYADS